MNSIQEFIHKNNLKPFAIKNLASFFNKDGILAERLVVYLQFKIPLLDILVKPFFMKIFINVTPLLLKKYSFRTKFSPSWTCHFRLGRISLSVRFKSLTSYIVLRGADPSLGNQAVTILLFYLSNVVRTLGHTISY